MSLTLVTAPTGLPLTLAEVKAGARLAGLDESEDALIASYLRSAVASLDGRDGWLGRCLLTQTWEYKIDCFPIRSAYAWRAFAQIRLPLQPLQSVVSIEYVDLAGATQTLASSLYQVVNVGDGSAKIVPAHGEDWPDTREQPEAVTVQFVSGYGDTANDVPEPIRHALMLMVAHAYDGCHSDAPERLLSPYRVIMRPGPMPAISREYLWP